MTRLAWDSIGTRVYELGVERGVLYLDSGEGVAWSGLISVKESSSGGTAKPFYQDGVKYANRPSREEFEATIEAYTYPEEFARCDGTASIANGLFATRQRRKPFSLSYRTGLGNDVDGAEHGYKIHLVYNALAAPTDRSYDTISDDINPLNFSWNLTVRPPALLGYRPTAHFVIDSRDTPEAVMTAIEDILYGTENAAARLPTVGELVFRFQAFQAGIHDAGRVGMPYYLELDGGHISETQTTTIDGGGA